MLAFAIACCLAALLMIVVVFSRARIFAFFTNTCTSFQISPPPTFSPAFLSYTFGLLVWSCSFDFFTPPGNIPFQAL